MTEVEAEAHRAASLARDHGIPEVATVIEQLLLEVGARQRQREEWTSIVAHDLRQPVNNMNLWLGVLERQAKRPGADLANGFEHARSSVRQLDRMISDLLDASRLEANLLTLQRSATDLIALVRGVVGRAADEVKGRLRFEPTEPLSPLEVDPARIEQVLTNLIASSAKYGTPGTPIAIDLSGADAEVRVAVVNQGPGLAPEDAEQLFRRRDISGLGLGLYISRCLVEAHGGQVWIDSSPGETTAFHFTLPRKPPKTLAPAR